MFTRVFWRDTAERAISTGAQFAIAAVGQDVVGADLFAWSFANVAGAFGAGAVLSVLKCLAAGRMPGTVSPASFTEV